MSATIDRAALVEDLRGMADRAANGDNVDALRAIARMIEAGDLPLERRP